MLGLRSLVLVLVILLSGAHVVGTQVYAWASMTVERAQSKSLIAALQSVVMGTAPCHICRAVDQLQVTVTPSAPQPTVGQADLAPAELVMWILPQSALIARLSPIAVPTPGTWAGEVPTPPPRGC